MSKQTDYVQQVYNSARQMGLNDTVARLAAAQSAIETAYGTKVVGNNYFGIKAGKSWDGPVVGSATKEEVGGNLVSTNANFRSYDGFSQSLSDWYGRIQARWPEVLNAKNIEEAAAALKAGQKGGYATDSDYAAKVVNVSARAPDPVAPTPASMPQTVADARTGSALDAIKSMVGSDPTSVLSGYGGGQSLTTAPIDKAPWISQMPAPAADPTPGGNTLADTFSGLFKGATAALGGLAQPNPSAPVPISREANPVAPPASAPASNQVQYPSSVTMTVPLVQVLADIRKAQPMAGMLSDQALTSMVLKKLPPYVAYDPQTGDLTVNDINTPAVQGAMAQPIADKNVAAVVSPYLQAMQSGARTPLPLPRDARPAPAPSAAPSYQQGMTGRGLPAPSFPADYNPMNALSVMQAEAPAKAYATPTPWRSLAAQSAGSKPVQPSSPQVGASNLSPSIIPAAPWATPLPAAARTLLAKPYSVSTQTLAPTQAMTPTGAITTVDMMRALSDPNYKPAAPLAPAPVPAPVTWTTTSTLPAPAAPAKPSFNLGNPLDGGVLGLGGFGGGLMSKLFSSVFQSTPAGRIPGSATPQPGFAGYSNAPKVAPRGEFGQALGVGGLYNQGAIWGANGGGYGSSPGQVTTGLKSGERVYDPNTGEWGLKVGQPVTWTKSGGSSSGGAGTTGTFQGTSTKNSYTVGQTYKNGNGTYVAQADGTFKRV